MPKKRTLSAKGYAVVQTGGKQYLVHPSDTLKVEKLDADVGAKVEIDTVLALSDGKKLQVGAPTVEGAKVTCEIADQISGEKVVSFKKKRRKGYSRKKGHRQKLTVLTVQSIG